MGRADDIFEAYKGRVLCRFFFEDVKGCAGNLSGDDRIVKIFFADNTPPCTVDDKNTLLHFGKSFGIDHPFRFFSAGSMYGNEIGFFQQLV